MGATGGGCTGGVLRGFYGKLAVGGGLGASDRVTGGRVVAPMGGGAGRARLGAQQIKARA